jgi:hypothetical protein
MAGNHMALDIRIAGRYRLGRKIGSGSFGDIYLGACDQGQGPRNAGFGPAIRKVCAGRACVVLLTLGCRSAGTHIQTGEEVGIKLVRACPLLCACSRCDKPCPSMFC